MSKVVKVVAAVGFIALGVLTGGVTFLPGTALAFSVGASTFLAVGIGLAASLIAPAFQKTPGLDRAAAAAQLQLGETPRAAILGRAGTEGSLVDAFNFGGEYGTDWEVLVIALADHECDALEGFYVNEAYVEFAGDGAVSGYNGQLEVYWKSGTYDQTASSYLTTNGPGWTANDRGRSVCYVVVAYKADEPDAENPIWPGGRPRFKWVLRGLKCYQARLDTTVGGSGSHRWDDPSTWEWTENLIDARYNWVRGIYAGNLVDQPEMLLIGRGLSEVEAPPANVFARANLCDEVVDSEARYRVGGLVFASETFLEVESAFAAACAGVIVQREGSVEIDPGEAKAAVMSFTDDDFIVGSKVTFSDFLGADDRGWVNTVVARFPDPDQKWTQRGAPVKRDTDDIAADGAPREETLNLGLVPYKKQAERVAEVTRRLGRLWGRGQVTLPPQFAALEEGDWVEWTSARRFGGATKTFRVEAWGSNEAWHHQLTLREISSTAYSDVAAGTDGAVATPATGPGALAAPGVSAWTSTGTAVSGVSGSIPAVQVTGAADNAYASRIRVEFRVDGESDWEVWGEFGRATTRTVITGLADQTDYEVAIAYLVDGEWTPRRTLAAVTTGAIASPPDAATLLILDDYDTRLDTLEGPPP